VLPGAVLKLDDGTPVAGPAFEAAFNGGLLQPVPDDGLRAPEEGQHWLAVVRRDESGKASPVQWWRLRVEADTVPPEIQWRVVSALSTGTGADGQAIYRPPVTVEVTATDDRSGVENLEWSVSGGAVLPLDPPSGPASFETWAPKVHIAAHDAAGNEGFVEIVWGVDSQPPYFLLRRSDGRLAYPGELLKVRVGDTATLEALDASGVSSQSYNLNGAWQNTPGTITFREKGKFTLEAKAVDSLGNEARAQWPVKVRRGRGR
jgi:hypothetical protein